MIEASCPFCGHTFYIKRDMLAISSINTQIVQRLHDRTHFSHLCSNCHRIFHLMHPFMLKNAEKKYCLVLSDKDDFSDFDEEGRILITKSVPQFYLAFKILEEGLNFSIVLKKKKQLETKLNCCVNLDSYDPIHRCLWFETDSQCKAILLSKEEAKEIEIVYNDNN